MRLIEQWFQMAALAAIVLIRTFPSFTIEMEIAGRSPWTRGGRQR